MSNTDRSNMLKSLVCVFICVCSYHTYFLNAIKNKESGVDKNNY